MASIGYHPERSIVNEDRFADFIRSPITGDLLEIPGIGPVAQDQLRKNHGITTTYQLLGKYLSFKDETTGCVEHTDRFYHWLCTTGVQNIRRAGVVRCIASKASTMFPGIYDDDDYNDEVRNRDNEDDF
jgi:hypothetical protein